MTTPPLQRTPGRCRRFILASGLALACLLAQPVVQAIPLTGANGRSVDFFRVESASPQGLEVRMTEGSEPIRIAWEKFDLAALEREHPSIHAAYLRAQAGETVALEMGGAAAMKSDSPAAPASPPDAAKYPGWVDTKVGKVEFMIQMPATKPRGILLYSRDDFGDSFRWIQHHERGRGDWGIFQTKFDMALLTYSTRNPNMDPSQPEDFIFPQKGSGKALQTALQQLGSKLNQPELANLPIAIYGIERTGAAFGYNLVHHFPERILAAALYDGGYYDAEPTEASAKVPMLFMWGQYSSRPELWNTQNTTQAVLAKAAPLKPLWTNAREFRGRGEWNGVIEHFAKQYLLSMVEARLPAAEAPAAPPTAEGEAAKEGSEASASAAPSSLLRELDRAAGSVGDILTAEVKKITDPDAELGENEAFLPNAVVIRYWKDFVLGELQVPQ